MQLENPPFGRGETFYQGNAIDANNLGGLQYEGCEFWFNDLTYTTAGAKPARTNRMVLCRIVRNVSGIALLPSRVATWQIAGTDGKFSEGRVDGYCATTAQPVAGVVDEWLPAAGVVNNDLFWIVVQGPTLIYTASQADVGNVINIGDYVCAQTAATSQSTTSGRIADSLFTGATLPLANQCNNKIGRALSAATTSNTNSLLLVDCNVYR